MLTSFLILLVIQAVSLLIVFLVVQVFRSQVEKYRMMLTGMGNQGAWGKPGKAIIITYVVLAILVTIVTTLLFVFQPHWL